MEITVVKGAEPVDPYRITDFADGDLSNVTSPTASYQLVEKDGANWLEVSSGGGDWVYLNGLNYSCGTVIDAIEIEMTSTANVTAGSAYLYTEQGEFYATGVTNDGNVYRFTFDKEFTQVNQLALIVAANSTLQIKQVRAYVNPSRTTALSMENEKTGNAIEIPITSKTVVDVSCEVRYPIADDMKRKMAASV